MSPTPKEKDIRNKHAPHISSHFILHDQISTNVGETALFLCNFSKYKLFLSSSLVDSTTSHTKKIIDNKYVITFYITQRSGILHFATFSKEAWSSMIF